MSALAFGPHDARFLPLEGTLNTRDLGGLPAGGGRVTLPGRVLRSDGPASLTDADLSLLSRLPLTTVVDLRGKRECEREPSRFLSHPGVNVHNVEVWSHIDAAGQHPTDRFDITAFYLAALDHAGPAFAEATRLIADAPGASLFHCSAGKDRTGLLAALLLEAVGVDRATVLEDFALTEDRIGPLRQRLLDQAERDGVARTEFVRLLGATPDLMAPALDHLDARYGGALPYLSGIGVSEDTLEKLEKKLVGQG
ncbi:MAG TPA: tyrosine-protein phosphatase [Trueperaceae bacterium]